MQMHLVGLLQSDLMVMSPSYSCAGCQCAPLRTNVCLLAKTCSSGPYSKTQWHCPHCAKKWTWRHFSPQFFAWLNYKTLDGLPKFHPKLGTQKLVDFNSVTEDNLRNAAGEAMPIPVIAFKYYRRGLICTKRCADWTRLVGELLWEDLRMCHSLFLLAVGLCAPLGLALDAAFQHCDDKSVHTKMVSDERKSLQGGVFCTTCGDLEFYEAL
eukprot:1686515-Amphidinium_carterae.2